MPAALESRSKQSTQLGRYALFDQVIQRWQQHQRQHGGGDQAADHHGGQRTLDVAAQAVRQCGRHQGALRPEQGAELLRAAAAAGGMPGGDREEPRLVRRARI